jgi:hypothetical protein
MEEDKSCQYNIMKLSYTKISVFFLFFNVPVDILRRFEVLRLWSIMKGKSVQNPFHICDNNKERKSGKITFTLVYWNPSFRKQKEDGHFLSKFMAIFVNTT